MTSHYHGRHSGVAQDSPSGLAAVMIVVSMYLML